MGLLTQVIIRNIDDGVIARLKKRAAGQGLSLEESLRRALAALGAPSKEDVTEQLRRIRAMSPPRTKPPFSEDLVREGRDER
jgi:plasmid stability protein